MYHFDRVAGYYAHDPHKSESYATAAAQLEYPDARRAALVKALEAQNGPSPELSKLAQPGTVAVVTGQQVGLFSGPAYTVFKAVTAAKVTANLNQQGIPAVTIFWLASEDHDFPEVNHVDVFDADHRPVRLMVDLPKQFEGQTRPVGNVPVTAPPIEALRKTLHGLPHADEVMAAVEAAYRPGVTMTEGFRALVKSILGKLGLIFLDPLDPAIRAIGAPFIAEALKNAPELKASLLKRNHELTSAGYHAQVHMEEKTSLFFLLENGQRVSLRKKDHEFAELADRAAEISPNALLRPVLQDYLLPSVAYVGGPAELAYFAQSKVIYDRLLGRMPVMVARSCFTLIDSRASKLAKRYNLGLRDITVADDLLKDRIAKTLIPESLEASLEKNTSAISRELDAMSREIGAFDPTLGAALAKSRAKITHQVEKLRKKMTREALRRDQRAAAEAEYLGNLIYPHKHLQERLYSILPFLAKHGMDLPEQIFNDARLDCPDHRILSF